MMGQGDGDSMTTGDRDDNLTQEIGAKRSVPPVNGSVDMPMSDMCRDIAVKQVSVTKEDIHQECTRTNGSDDLHTSVDDAREPQSSNLKEEDMETDQSDLDIIKDQGDGGTDTSNNIDSEVNNGQANVVAKVNNGQAIVDAEDSSNPMDTGAKVNNDHSSVVAGDIDANADVDLSSSSPAKETKDSDKDVDIFDKSMDNSVQKNANTEEYNPDKNMGAVQNNVGTAERNFGSDDGSQRSENCVEFQTDLKGNFNSLSEDLRKRDENGLITDACSAAAESTVSKESGGKIKSSEGKDEEGQSSNGISSSKEITEMETNSSNPLPFSEGNREEKEELTPKNIQSSSNENMEIERKTNPSDHLPASEGKSNEKEEQTANNIISSNEKMERESKSNSSANLPASDTVRPDVGSVSGKIVESTDDFIIVQNSDSDDSDMETEITDSASKTADNGQEEEGSLTMKDLVEMTVGNMDSKPPKPSTVQGIDPPASQSSSSQSTKPPAQEPQGVKNDVTAPEPTVTQSQSTGNSQSPPAAVPAGKSAKENQAKKKSVTPKEPNFHGEAPKSMGLVGAFLFNIGLDIAKEKAYKSLTRVQSKRLKEEKLEQKEQEQLEKMKKEHVVLQKRNALFHHKKVKCHKCDFKTESQNVLEHHMEYPHMELDKMNCAFCNFHSRQPIAFTYHMRGQHSRNARFIPRALFHQCSLCFFENNHKNRLMQHDIGCKRRFDINKNLAPTNNFLHHSLSVEVKKPPPPAPPKPRPSPALTSLMSANRSNVQSTAAKPGASVSQHLAGMQTFNINGLLYVWTKVGLVPMKAAAQALRTAQPISSVIGGAATLQQKTPPTPVQMYAAAAASAGSNVAQPVSIKQILKRPAPVDTNGPKPPKQSKDDYEVCELCDGFVMNRDALRVHFYYAHQINMSPEIFHKYKAPPLTCAVCAATFWTSQGWTRHSKTHFQNECYICKKSCQQLVTHLEVAHGLNFLNLVEINRCVSCGKTFMCEKELEGHMSKYHGLSLQPMKMVAEVRTASVAKDRSRINKTPVAVAPPLAPPRKRTTAAAAKRSNSSGNPQASLLPPGLYECKVCGIRNFSNVQEYYHHFGEKHGGLGCRHCSVKFNSLDELGYHLFLAHKEKLFMCNKCGFGALSTSALRQHMVDVHDKVQCPLCVKKIEGSLYKNHLMGHTKKCRVRLERLSKDVLRQYGIALPDVDANSVNNIAGNTKSIIGDPKSYEEIILGD